MILTQIFAHLSAFSLMIAYYNVYRIMKAPKDHFTPVIYSLKLPNTMGYAMANGGKPRKMVNTEVY